MNLYYRVLRISISLVNIAVVVIILTSAWPFLTGSFSVDLPEESDFQWGYSDGVATLSLPIGINNGGFYDIEDVSVFTLARNSTGFEIINMTNPWGTIQAGSYVIETFDFSIDFGELLSSGADWMIFNPDFFDVHIVLNCKYTWKLIHFTADYNLPFPWEGLIKELEFGTPTLDNSTGEFEVHVPYYISTNSLLAGLGGTLKVDITNGTGVLLSSCNESISLGIDYGDTFVLRVTEDAYLDLFFNDQTLTATITVTFAGISMEIVRYIEWDSPGGV